MSALRQEYSISVAVPWVAVLTIMSVIFQCYLFSRPWVLFVSQGVKQPLLYIFSIILLTKGPGFFSPWILSLDAEDDHIKKDCCIYDRIGWCFVYWCWSCASNELNTHKNSKKIWQPTRTPLFPSNIHWQPGKTIGVRIWRS